MHQKATPDKKRQIDSIVMILKVRLKGSSQQKTGGLQLARCTGADSTLMMIKCCMIVVACVSAPAPAPPARGLCSAETRGICKNFSVDR